MGILIFVISAFCVNFVVCESTYNAAVVRSNEEYIGLSRLIHEAAHLNADIVVLPSPKYPVDNSFAEVNNYEEVTKFLSQSAKQAKVYILAHVYDKIQCQHQDELIRNNLVFDRQGGVVAVYRKPLNNKSNCTSPTQPPVFTTDFGVTFALLMEEDLVLQNPELLKIKNYLVAGGLQSDIQFLSGQQFASSWAYVTNANLVTSSGVFAGRAGRKTGEGEVVGARLNKDGGVANSKCTTTPSSPILAEDLSQYIIRPLDMLASMVGYTDTICQGRFCCEFYVKTSSVGSSQHEVSYGLAAFDGIRHFAGRHHIGAQSCSIAACAGLYKRSCALGPNNSTNTHFEKIIIRANFSKINSAQFPIITSTSEKHNINFETNFSKDTKKVTLSIENGKNLLNFGIFGRDYSKDFESQTQSRVENGNYYDYFFNEDVQEFFDYIWIRLRVLIFIVSIYVLEMM